MRIRDPGWRQFGSGPGWKKVGSGIRDKHPGSATLLLPPLYPLPAHRTYPMSAPTCPLNPSVCYLLPTLYLPTAHTLSLFLPAISPPVSYLLPTLYLPTAHTLSMLLPAISPPVCDLLPTLYLPTAPTLRLPLPALLPSTLSATETLPCTCPLSVLSCPPAHNQYACYRLPTLYLPTYCLLTALKLTCLLPFSLHVTYPLLCLFLPTFQ